MPTIVSQTASASFSESPITVDVQATSLLTSSSLKLVCELYVWNGADSAQPATPSYTLKKFPLDSGGNRVAVFDLSPILNSFTSASLGESLDSGTSNSNWFTYEVYEEAKNSSGTIITGSHSSPTGEPFMSVGGYLKWGEKRDLAGSDSLSDIVDSFPLLTSAPISQSIISTDVPFYFSAYARTDKAVNRPTNVLFTDSLGSTQSITLTSGQTDSNYTVGMNYITAAKLTSWKNAGAEWFTMVARNSTTPVSDVYHIDLDCQKKYTPQRIIFKNRGGGFDQFEFGLVSRTSMNAETQTYQQNALNMYNGQYNSQQGVTTYTTQGNESIVVNTDYISEDYNEFFKEMMVSEEIYLVEPQESVSDALYGATWTLLTLESKNMTFKKSEVDKLIQYTFTFRYGTPYKLVL